MRIAVTGTRGFVGGHLVARLASDRHEVMSLARAARSANFPEAVEHLEVDLRTPFEIPGAVDALVHCAAMIPARCADGDELIAQNEAMARNTLAAAISAGARRIVYMSSMAVYGAVSAETVDAHTPPQNPAPYGIAKQTGETIARDACREAGIAPPVSLRLPGVVGRGSHDNFLSGAMTRILAGERISARNPDAPFNNILFVDDLCAFVEALLSRETWPSKPQAFPLASREPATIDTILRMMFKGVGRTPEIDYPDPPDHSFLIDSSSAEALDYRPRTVRESVAAFVESVSAD